MLDDLRVCFLGDSFVAGTGDPEHRGWVGRLAEGTHAAGQPLTSYNLGVRRQTSAEVLGRWRAETEPRLPRGCRGRVVVSFGVNDTTLEDGRQRVATRDGAAHLGALLAAARSRSWPVLVVGPPPVADEEHNARTALLDARFQDVCATAAVPYAATLATLLATPVWRRQVAEGDGAHPGAEGYAALADAVRPAWQRWLAAPGGT